MQTGVGDSLHCVEMAVRPIDPLGDDIQGYSCWNANSSLYQLKTIGPIHEGTFNLHLLIGKARVCEEHVAANRQRKNLKGCFTSFMTQVKWMEKLLIELLSSLTGIIQNHLVNTADSDDYTTAFKPTRL